MWYTLSIVHSLVDHDLAEDSAKQPAEAIGKTPRLDVHVSGAERFTTLQMKLRPEQRVVESRHEPTHRRFAERLFSGRIVGVHNQLVQVVHIVTVVDFLVCIDTFTQFQF